MYGIYKHDGNVSYGVKEFVLDSFEDIATLPTNQNKVRPGSIALIIPTSEVYMLNNQYQWVLIGSQNSSDENENPVYISDNAGELREF